MTGEQTRKTMYVFSFFFGCYRQFNKLILLELI